MSAGSLMETEKPMEADLDLILKETARLARDFGFNRTADLLDAVLADLLSGGQCTSVPRRTEALH